MTLFSRKKRMVFGINGLLSALMLISFESSAAQKTHRAKIHLPDGETLENYRSPAASRAPELIYATYETQGTRFDRISEAAWVGDTDFRSGTSTFAKRFTPGMRYQYLWNAFYANTRAKSNSGLRHSACFMGDPVLFANRFFNRQLDLGYLDPQVGIEITVSRDRYLIGIEGSFKPPNRPPLPFHFRLPSCAAPGKGELVSQLLGALSRQPSSDGLELVPLTAADRAAIKVMMDEPEYTPEKKANREPQAVASRGFEVLDTVTDPAASSLARFNLSADYEAAQSKWNEAADRPWKGMDIRTPEAQLRLSQLLLDYVYDGMVNVGNQQTILYAERNQKRYWCNMPWLNVGDSGREAIHGLTKERGLQKSPIYPDATEGSDWGIGFYNGQGCRGIHSVFGSRSAPKDKPTYFAVDWPGSKGFFPDGSIAVKFLFTTANFSGLDGTHVMHANVTHEKGQTKRRIMPVRLIQIDIALKDSSLVGARGALDHWVMTTYYYDPTYVSQSSLPGVPPGFRKMRPQGLQVGLGLPPTDSTIFKGAKSNGIEGRLNGPADNSKGSCMGCHATAGGAVPMVPGLMKDPDYVQQKGFLLDFSQQLSLAKRNQETQPKMFRKLE